VASVSHELKTPLTAIRMFAETLQLGPYSILQPVAEVSDQLATLGGGILKYFTVSFDRSFRAVMEGCAASRPGRKETWISPEFIEAYTRLYEQGHAHSFECWLGTELVGGIYGVAIGGLFAGESMFHRADNASKVALYHLIQHLRTRGFVLFEIQMLTPVTRQLGGITIPREEYLRRLAAALKVAPDMSTFQP